jgi:hypothetical protein
MDRSMTRSGSMQTVGLGLLGMLGGVVLLAAYAVDIPGGWNPLRIVLFNIGAIAVVIGVHRRQAHIAPRLALVAAVSAILANATHAVMVVIAVDRPSPFSGDFGFAWFVVALVMWLSDGLFGVVTLRLGAMWRWGALALAVGSPLAVLGMGRLGLTSPADPTIFGPLALTGVALNGLGWILLGLELVALGAGRRRAGLSQAET